MEQFRILGPRSEDPGADFARLIEALELHFKVSSEAVGNNAKEFRLPGAEEAAVMHFEPASLDDADDRTLMISVGVSQHFQQGFELLRYLLGSEQFGWRLIDLERGCIVPSNPALLSAGFHRPRPKAIEVLNSFGLTAQFVFQPTRTWYATNAQGEVELINTHLLNFFGAKGSNPSAARGEFSYRVAGNLDFFTKAFERNLIPIDFYRGYKRSLKIINESFFDIENPGRKVFVKPYIFEFDALGSSHYNVTDADRKVLYMDKIRKNETLDGCLLRILRQELKIADDYLGAYVHREVEFDLDRDARLTPRLIVSVYVDKIQDRQKFEQASQTGWRSLKR